LWRAQDLNHTSNTAYLADNYTNEWRHPEWAPWGWTGIIKGHPCYQPEKVWHPSVPHAWSVCEGWKREGKERGQEREGEKEGEKRDIETEKERGREEEEIWTSSDKMPLCHLHVEWIASIIHM
jgi:hypothetical protein